MNVFSHILEAIQFSLKHGSQRSSSCTASTKGVFIKYCK